MSNGIILVMPFFMPTQYIKLQARTKLRQFHIISIKCFGKQYQNNDNKVQYFDTDFVSDSYTNKQRIKHIESIYKTNSIQLNLSRLKTK